MTSQQMTLLVLAGVGVAVVAVLLLSNAPPAVPARAAMTVQRTFAPMTSYQNAEEWEFKRDPRSGFITDIRVHRDARVGRAG